jgi:hypothetical protein
MKPAIPLAVALLLPSPVLADAITLDTSRSVGPTVSITTPSGIACSETAGDRPSVWFGGRAREQTNANQTANPWTTSEPSSQTTYINSNLFNDENGWSVGVGVHIPFGGPPTGNCKRFLAIAERESKVNILNQLLANKAISLDEYQHRMLQLYEESNGGHVQRVTQHGDSGTPQSNQIR